MSTLQIVLLVVSGVFAVLSLVFMTLFIIDITTDKDEEEVVKNTYSTNDYSAFININEVKAESVDEMLANLDAQTKGETAKAEEKEEAPVITVKEIVENVQVEETKEEPAVEEVKVEEPTVEEVKVEEPAVEELVVEEKTEEPVVEEVVEEEPVVEETKAEEVKVEEKKEIKEEPIENFAAIDESAADEPNADEDEVELLSDLKELKSDKHEIKAGSVIDYKTRLDKIIETRNKIEKDLAKLQKSILKYERTKRRKNRNQKMLDRRAGELTNLNLVMYSVTDIKNVDEEKKVKQEELTAHIAELKASIQDDEEFIESNKEKNDHNVKMAKFLIQEKSRYNDEIAELQALIASTGEDTTVVV